GRAIAGPLPFPTAREGTLSGQLPGRTILLRAGQRREACGLVDLWLAIPDTKLQASSTIHALSSGHSTIPSIYTLVNRVSNNYCKIKSSQFIFADLMRAEAKRRALLWSLDILRLRQ